MHPDYVPYDGGYYYADPREIFDGEEAAPTFPKRQGFKIFTVDGDVFFADSYSYYTEGVKLDGSGLLVLMFAPKNGYDKGKLHKVPVQRVTHIVDLSDEPEL